MELNHKLNAHSIVHILLFCNLVIAIKGDVYSNLKSRTEITITIVERAKQNVTTQLAILDPYNNSTNNNWYFGVPPCWNTTLNEAERLDDVYRRLKILRRHAVALNISRKNYVRENLAMEIGNLYRFIKNAKRSLGYSGITAVPKQTIYPFITKTTRDKMLVDTHFLATLRKNLYLTRQDFGQKISTTV